MGFYDNTRLPFLYTIRLLGGWSKRHLFATLSIKIILALTKVLEAYVFGWLVNQMYALDLDINISTMSILNELKPNLVLLGSIYF